MKTITLEDAAWSKILEAVQRHSDEGPPNSGLQSVELEVARKGLESALEDQPALEQAQEVEALVVKIRELAWQVGMLEQPEWLDVNGKGLADAVEYSVQVRSGLATAVTQILKSDFGAIMQFHSYCIFELAGLDDPIIEDLFRVLQNEIEDRSYPLGEKEDPE